MEANVKSSGGLRRVSIVLSCLFMVLGLTLPAPAATVAIFGPQEYVRGEGKPTSYNSIFTTPEGVTNCRLLISYGGEGALIANNFSVIVNGIEMGDSKTFRLAEGEKVVAKLQDENVIQVTLKGKPGDSVIVQVLGDIPDRPQFPDRPLFSQTP